MTYKPTVLPADKMLNGKPSIFAASQLPARGMKMRVSIKDGMLLIELEKTVNYLQFNKQDAIAFIKGLVPIVNSMGGGIS